MHLGIKLASTNRPARGSAGYSEELLSALPTANAVDIFIYDTRLDSDGGAWRTGALAQASSWYTEPLNTAVRGSRQEFPVVAAIVAETDKVTIFDADNPSLPMWMVFEGGSYRPVYTSGTSSLAAKNGVICVGSVEFLGSMHFVSDFFRVYRSGGDGGQTDNISVRNNTLLQYDFTANQQAIVNNSVNDVAMVVLPGAPTDPTTGLPTPTIAIATDGGVSVIKDDGAVVDITWASEGIAGTVCFDAQQNILVVIGAGLSTYQSHARVYAIPHSDLAELHGYSTSPNDLLYIGLPRRGDVSYSIHGNIVSTAIIVSGAVGHSRGGLTLYSRNVNAASQSMVAFAASNYATGWMVGAIKGAWLADTDQADLIGSGELATNGTFDTDISGWNNVSESGGTIGWNALGYLDITTGATNANEGKAQQSMATTPGKNYVLTFDVVSGGGVIINSSAQYSVGTGHAYSFLANSTSMLFTVRNFGNTNGTSSVDNLSLKLVELDRSTNIHGLTVNGTITRAPVAPGAELVAYSGFSTGNTLSLTDASMVDTLYGLCWVQTPSGWQLQHGVISTGPIEGVSISSNTLTLGGSLPKALLRLTATTPTPEQITKINSDEGSLFKENAACTLYGSSDAVTALAYDKQKAALHVGTSAGRSVFKKLLRVANTANPITAVISAVSGKIAEK